MQTIYYIVLYSLKDLELVVISQATILSLFCYQSFARLAIAWPRPISKMFPEWPKCIFKANKKSLYEWWQKIIENQILQTCDTAGTKLTPPQWPGRCAHGKIKEARLHSDCMVGLTKYVVWEKISPRLSLGGRRQVVQHDPTRLLPRHIFLCTQLPIELDCII